MRIFGVRPEQKRQRTDRNLCLVCALSLKKEKHCSLITGAEKGVLKSGKGHLIMGITRGGHIHMFGMYTSRPNTRAKTFPN